MEFNTSVIVLVLLVDLLLLGIILSESKVKASNYRLIMFLGICIGIMLSVGVFLWLYFINIEVSFDEKYYLELFKTLVPVISVIITSVSLVITATNFKKTSDKAIDVSDSNQIMDMIKLNNEIYKGLSNQYPNIFHEIQKELISQFDGDKLWTIRGIEFIDKYLFSDETKNNRLSIINELEKFEFKKNSIFYHQNKKLISYLNKESNNGKRQLWLLLNYEVEKRTGKGIKLNGKVSNLKLNYSYVDKILIKNAILKPVYENVYQDGFYTRPVSYDEAYLICNEVYEKKFEILGNFFRSTHRIIKKINESFNDDMESKKNYLGLLRAQLPESAIALIFYNATYTKKGLGLARQLLYTDFFGDISDFMTTDMLHIDDSQHISPDKIIFYNTDYKIMSNLYTHRVEYYSKNEITIEKTREIIKAEFTVNEAENYRKSLNRVA